jgi:putative lipoic acid-binding regulatory protein
MSLLGKALKKVYFLFLLHYICCLFSKFKMDKKTEEFYARLKDKLNDTSIWPSEYLFKFIVPSDLKKIVEIESAFNNMGAVIKTKQSKTGKYTSVSVDVQMQNPDAVITKYLEVSGIEGIISL